MNTLLKKIEKDNEKNNSGKLNEHTWEEASQINLTELENKILSVYEWDLADALANSYWCSYPWDEQDLLENPSRDRGALSSLIKKGIIHDLGMGWELGELGIRVLILKSQKEGTLQKHLD